MKKNIWIFNHYATDTILDHGGRHYSFAKYLKRKGYNVRIFCASTVHNTDINFDTKGAGFSELKVDDIDYTIIKTSNYSGNGLSRIKNMFQFYFRIFRVVKCYKKPDIILASSVHPLALVAGIKISKKLNIKCVCEIRDLWPESLVEYNIISRNNILTRFMYKGEKWIYKNANNLIFTMPGAKKYITDSGWDREVDLAKVFFINNGIDLEVYNENKIKYPFYDSDLDNPNYKKVVYTGSLRMANKAESFIEIAESLRNISDKIKLLIFGDGDNLQILKNKALDKNLKNIIFKGKVEKKYIPSILSKSDLNIMDGDKGGISKYGISGNKLFDYIASGKPIIMDASENEFGIINKNKIGIAQNFTSPSQFAEAIDDMLNGDSLRYEAWCSNSADLSKEFDFKWLTNKLADIIENCN